MPVPTDVEVADAPPSSTMAGWMSSMAKIGTMVENQPPPPGKVDGVGEVPTKKEGGDGKTGPGVTAPVETGKPAAPPAGAAAAPAANAGEAGANAAGDTGDEKWPRSAKDWDSFKEKRKKAEDALRSQINEREAKLKETEAKLAELSSKPAKTEPDGAIKAEIDALKEGNAELSKRLAAADTVNHPRFIQDFIEPIKEQIEMAKGIVGPDKADQVAKILNMADSEYKTRLLEEFESDLQPIQQRRLDGLLNDLEKLDRRKQKALAETDTWAKTNLAAKTLADQEHAKADFQKREKSFSETLGAIVAHPKLDLFKPKEGDDAWNRGLNERVAKAKELYLGKGKAEELAGAALFAVSMPLLVEKYNADLKGRDEAIAKLQAQIKALTAAQPGGDKGHGAGAPEAGKGEGDAGPKEGMRPDDATSAFVKGMHSMLKDM